MGDEARRAECDARRASRPRGNEALHRRVGGVGLTLRCTRCLRPSKCLSRVRADKSRESRRRAIFRAFVGEANLDLFSHAFNSL